MNKKKIIKEIFGECPMAKDYKLYVEDGDFHFIKEEDGIQKIFTIQDLYGAHLQIVFLTNVHVAEYVTDLVDKSICNIDPGWGCEYKNEEEFRAIVLEAKRIFEEYSEEMFQKLSIPPKRDDSTPEMEKELFENREQLIKDGIQYLGIEGTVGMKQVQMIVEKVKELHGKPFEDVISDLIMLSAVYGRIYCETSHGEWEFDGTIVSIVDKKTFLLVQPLKEMIFAWTSPEKENLTTFCELAWKKHNHYRG